MSARSNSALPRVQYTHATMLETIDQLIAAYNSRADYFSDSFVSKVKDGSSKAMAKLKSHPLQPNIMDLRSQLDNCIHTEVSDEHSFTFSDGRKKTMLELRTLIPEWASIAEQALIDSDPALADKLMSRDQWNAKTAFEVTFVSAMNELKDIRKTSLVSSPPDHYKKWILDPLKKAADQVRAALTPKNAPIGYGDKKISLAKALEEAERVQLDLARRVGVN